MAESLAYCEEKVATAGSDFAMTRVFAPPEQRAALTALYALYAELMNVAYSVSDADLARAKLAWWHGELERAMKNQAQHPIAQTLHQHAPGIFETEELNNMVQGARRNVDPQAPVDEAALLDVARHTGGARARLEALIAGTGEAALDAASLLGSASQLTRWLLLLPKDLSAGRLFIPLNELARFQLTRADLRRIGENESRRALIRAQCDRIVHLLDTGSRQIPSQARAPLRHLQVNAVLDRAWCRRIARSGENVFKQPPALHPMPRLFIAWRAAKQAQRASKS